MAGTPLLTAAVVAATALATTTVAQDPVGLPPPSPETIEGVFKSQKHYSPYAGRNFSTHVYWGDTHLHTALSMDAGTFGNRLGLDDAYRFTRGEEVTSSGGYKARLGRPLDFVVVADHSDGMGAITDIDGYGPGRILFRSQDNLYSASTRVGTHKDKTARVDFPNGFTVGDIWGGQ